MCHICDMQKELQQKAPAVARLQRRLEIAQMKFQDAAHEGDRTRADAARAEMHELIDLVCDSNYDVTVLQDRIVAATIESIFSSDPTSRPSHPRHH